MKHSNSYVKQKEIDWRRHKVLELLSNGYSEREIESIMSTGKDDISDTTVHRDIQWLKLQARDKLRKHVDEVMPLEYQKCLVGLEQTIKQLTKVIEDHDVKVKDPRDLISAISTRMQAYKFKAEVLDSGSAVDHAIALVERQKQQNITQDSTHQNGKVPIANNDISKHV
jgi:hypothetical protein